MLPVFGLILVVTFHAPLDFALRLVILVVFLLNGQFELEVLLKPLVVLDIYGLSSLFGGLVHDVVKGNGLLVLFSFAAAECCQACRGG